MICRHKMSLAKAGGKGTICDHFVLVAHARPTISIITSACDLLLVELLCPNFFSESFNIPGHPRVWESNPKP